MKKFFGVLAVLAVAVMISSSVFAASTQFTATADFSNSGVAEFDFTLVGGDNLTWDVSEIELDSSTVQWKKAQQYAVVAATITKANSYVTMYTKNKEANPNLEPDYNEWNGNTGVAGTETYGALVREGGTGGSYKGYVPIFYSLVPTQNASITFAGSDEAVATENRADRALVDQANGEYGNGNYATIASKGGPTFYTKDNKGTEQAPVWVDVQYPSRAVVDNTAYMYFFGGFKDVSSGEVYSTTIYVQQSWQ